MRNPVLYLKFDSFNLVLNYFVWLLKQAYNNNNNYKNNNQCLMLEKLQLIHELQSLNFLSKCSLFQAPGETGRRGGDAKERAGDENEGEQALGETQSPLIFVPSPSPSHLFRSLEQARASGFSFHT